MQIMNLPEIYFLCIFFNIPWLFLMSGDFQAHNLFIKFYAIFLEEFHAHHYYLLFFIIDGASDMQDDWFPSKIEVWVLKNHEFYSSLFYKANK